MMYFFKLLWKTTQQHLVPHSFLLPLSCLEIPQSNVCIWTEAHTGLSVIPNFSRIHQIFTRSHFHFSRYWAAVTHHTSNTLESAYHTQHLGIKKKTPSSSRDWTETSYSMCARKMLALLSPKLRLSPFLASFALPVLKSGQKCHLFMTYSFCWAVTNVPLIVPLIHSGGGLFLLVPWQCLMLALLARDRYYAGISLD